MKIKLELILIIALFSIPEINLGQGRDSRWLMGYANFASRPYGGTDLIFQGGIADTFYHSRNMNFNSTSSSICDESGNLLFYTNGVWVANRHDLLMPNGDQLNPSWYTTSLSSNNQGLNLPQSHIIVPKPGDSLLYYIFHLTIDTDYVGSLYSRYLYCSIVDISMDNGNGAVVSKNQIILNDQIVCGGLSAVKHANGRDWWIVGRQSFTHNFIEFLVTPDSIYGPYFQNIGSIRIESAPTGIFSQDGTQYAIMDGNYELDVFDFNRCNGLFSNWRHAITNSLHNNSSVAFSSTRNFIYVTNLLNIIQYDLSYSVLDSGKVIVAVWDSTYDPQGPPLATFFWICRLAPDNKIYISTGNGTIYLHVISSPDSAGFACDVRQHSIILPTYNFNSIPYFPNYSLGAVTGSICDSLTLNVINHNSHEDDKEINIFPNPTDRVLYISIGRQNRFKNVKIINSLGEEMSASGTFVKRGEYMEFNVSAFLPGVYFIELFGEKEKVVKRFVKIDLGIFNISVSSSIRFGRTCLTVSSGTQIFHSANI